MFKNKEYHFLYMKHISEPTMAKLTLSVNEEAERLLKKGYKVRLLSTLQGEKGYIQTLEVLSKVKVH
ncbi:hypothetical protein LS72_004595 [Helicobacter apodemus]|uniref:Uncharacterized protein n=1 Tax=Helicobacter apodemus TaxID=135569 RepID=A0A4U8UDQ4_9HELI|nr:hypothetical protein [Helicobacter apodemus]TLE16014.1 hypothetical protein LS72_004595 [Helicobacter apodemus]